MAATLKGTAGKGTFARGIHPADRKTLAAEMPIQVAPSPAHVQLPLLQENKKACCQ